MLYGERLSCIRLCKIKLNYNLILCEFLGEILDYEDNGMFLDYMKFELKFAILLIL